MVATATEILFDDVSRFIADSRALLQAGALIELAGLDEQVRILCDSVLRISQDDRVIHAGRLQQLLGDLKALGEEMAVQRDNLANEIRGIPEFKKASVAYRTVNAIKTSVDKDEEEES